MALLCLVLFGLLQVSYIVASRNVINYTAVATARAAAVGLNDFMLHKVSHYASIPTAGPNTTPGNFGGGNRPGGDSVGAVWDNAISRSNTPRSVLGEYEVGVKEAYHLASVSAFDLILDYDNWQHEETDIYVDVQEDPKLDMLHVTVEQTIPLVFPFSRVFFSHLEPVEAVRGDDTGKYPGKTIEAGVTIEDHAKLYLKDL
jgi:hypothetical protein